MAKIELRRFDHSDRDWLIDQHSAHYAREEGFDDTFGPMVAGIVDAFLSDHDPSCEQGWMAHRDGQRLGNVFCVRLDDQTAKLRLFLLVPEARGMGLGKQLLETCMQFARDAGYTKMQLWTHESQRAAGALYAKAGWRMIESNPAFSFGKENIEQTWVVTL